MFQLRIDGRPFAKQSARFGKGRSYAPPRIKARQQEIADATEAARNGLVYEGPVSVTIEFYGGTGDLDNMAKLVLDGLQQGGLFPNDKQVHKLHLHRSTPTKPNHTRVWVWSLA